MMRKFNVAVAAVFVLIVALPLIAAAQLNEKTARRELQIQYDRVNQAAKSTVARKEFSTAKSKLDALMTPDFTLVALDGQKVTKEMMTQFWLLEIQRYKSLNWNTQIQKLTLQGKQTVEVTVKNIENSTVMAPNGKSQRMTGESIARDTWVKTPAGWKWSKAVVLKERRFLDGKPLVSNSKPSN
jgi:hypothetical protein